LRVGRACPTLVADIRVGDHGPLKSLASIGVDGRTFVISPYGKEYTQPIMKALFQAGLGAMPRTWNDRMVLLDIPPLSGEQRKTLIRLAQEKAEAQRVAIRNIRRQRRAFAKNVIDGEARDRNMRVVDEMTNATMLDIKRIVDAKVRELSDE